jgi:hypothetical protein
MLRSSLRGLLVALVSVPVVQAQQNELSFCLDGSGSIAASDFTLQLEGVANAIEDPSIVPHNGQVAVSVVQFGGSNQAIIEVPRTVLNSNATAQNVAAAIRAIVKLNGGTPMAQGIDACVQALAGANPGAKQFICLATDGVPNSAQQALEARTNAINAGVDQIDAIGVGPGVDPNFLAQLVFQGGVTLVSTFEEFATIIGMKLQIIVGGVCLSGGRVPGSVLVYPVHRSGSGYFTIVSVTNVDTTPATPISRGGATGVHFQYVNSVPNPADPFAPLGCAVFDRHEYLTPADTMSVLTSCHNATTPGGQTGYLVVSAEDPNRFNVPWSHNRLVGSEIVMSASGYVYQLDAFPICAVGAAGQPTDADQDGRLDFDDIEYGSLPDVLIIDSFVALGGSQLALLNLTGDFADRNTVFFAVWNDNEFPLSTTLTFSCWFDEPLTNVSPLFSDTFLRALGANDPRELDVTCDGVGDLETGWAIVESIGVELPGGLPLTGDGALLGSITAGPHTLLGNGELLWESQERQNNGAFFGRNPTQPPKVH